MDIERNKIFVSYEEKVITLIIDMINKFNFSGTVAKRGIGTALVSEALNVASKHGINVVQCMALSLYTQKMCQRFNFEEFNRYDMK